MPSGTSYTTKKEKRFPKDNSDDRDDQVIGKEGTNSDRVFLHQQKSRCTKRRSHSIIQEDSHFCNDDHGICGCCCGFASTFRNPSPADNIITSNNDVTHPEESSGSSSTHVPDANPHRQR